MDQSLLLNGLFQGLILLVVGILLILFHYHLKLNLMRAIVDEMEGAFLNKVKKLIIETMSECMDRMPEKILEVKKTIEGG